MRWLVLALVAACSFQHGGASNPGGGSDGGGGSDAKAPSDAKLFLDAPRDAPPDAQTDACVANQSDCVLAGGLCVNGTCVITLFTNNNVMCPSNMPCDVVCAGQGTCSGSKVKCGAATSCEIDCAAANTCNGSTFDCDNVGCTINCLVDDICDGTTISDKTSSCAIACCGSGNECHGDTETPSTCTDASSTCPP